MSCSSSIRRHAWSRCVLATALLAAAFVAGPRAVLSADQTKPRFQIKFATLAPEGSTWMKTMHEIDVEVRRRTDNRLGFKFYPGGVQGDEKDVLRKIRAGQLHGGGFTGFGLGAVAPEVRVNELPFMFRSLDELDHLRSKTDPYFDGLFADKGFLHLGWADVGFIYLFSKQPIRSPDDLAKARMWVWAGDPLAELFFKAFDLSPIPLSAPDVLTALQTGVVDAVYGSALSCIALQWFTRIDYMTDVPITHGMGAALVSSSALKDVDPADVKVLVEVSHPLLRALTEKTRVQNEEAMGELRKEGVQVIEVTPDVRAEFFRVGRSSWKDGVGRLYPQELLDRVDSIVNDYRASAP